MDRQQFAAVRPQDVRRTGKAGIEAVERTQDFQRLLGHIQLRAEQGGLIRAELAAGNYVIAGGDYNHDMIGVSGEVYGKAAQAVESWAKPYDFDGVPQGCTVAAKAKLDETGTAACPDAATCRDAGRPYDGTNDRWVMDTFIYSDNVECLDCSTVDLDFGYSDHSPVAMTFKLR